MGKLILKRIQHTSESLFVRGGRAAPTYNIRVWGSVLYSASSRTVRVHCASSKQLSFFSAFRSKWQQRATWASTERVSRNVTLWALLCYSPIPSSIRPDAVRTRAGASIDTAYGQVGSWHALGTARPSRTSDRGYSFYIPCFRLADLFLTSLYAIYRADTARLHQVNHTEASQLLDTGSLWHIVGVCGERIAMAFSMASLQASLPTIVSCRRHGPMSLINGRRVTIHTSGPSATALPLHLMEYFVVTLTVI